MVSGVIKCSVILLVKVCVCCAGLGVEVELRGSLDRRSWFEALAANVFDCGDFGLSIKSAMTFFMAAKTESLHCAADGVRAISPADR